jgi:hypothetical protein
MRPQNVMQTHVLMLLSFALTACDAEYEKSPYLEGSPPHYVNPHYGLDVAIPAGLSVCVDDNGVTMSHGFLIPLTKNASCKSEQKLDHPAISVKVGSLFYDEPITTTNELVAQVCKGTLERVDVPELLIQNHDTAVCRGPFITRTNNVGFIEIAVMTWAGDGSGTNLQVSLITTEDRTQYDLEILKSVLSGIKSFGR